MLAAKKGDVTVAGVLIDGGADILIEDYVSTFVGTLITRAAPNYIKDRSHKPTPLVSSSCHDIHTAESSPQSQKR